MRQTVVKQRERREDMQTRRANTLALRFVAMLALVGALGLLGCPSDDEDAVIIGTQAVALNAGRAADLLGGGAFVFNGVPAFDTGRTRVVFNDDASEARISSGGDTASAGAEYGSCIFTPETSTFPAGSPLAPGADPIVIEVCNFVINGGEFTVGGLAGPCTVRLQLGLALSVPIDATCSVNADGNIVVDGVIITGSIGVEG